MRYRTLIELRNEYIRMKSKKTFPEWLDGKLEETVEEIEMRRIQFHKGTITEHQLKRYLVPLDHAYNEFRVAISNLKNQE